MDLFLRGFALRCAIVMLTCGVLLSFAGRASADDEIITQRHQPTYLRGDATRTVFGGVAGLVLSVGLAALSFAALDDSCPDDNPDDDGYYEYCFSPALKGMVVSVLAAPFLTAGGVTMAGNASGGTGGYGWSLLGGLLGLVPGAVLIGLAPDAVGAGLVLLPAGLVVGAVLGYRSSADPVIHASVALSPDRSGVRFSLNVAF